jgi:pSer/pThr/pTyr-binding forkhead associated (FHA) protein
MSTIVKKIIGRSLDCDYVIYDPKNRVSRKHLEVNFNGSFYFIKDLNSLNGTYLNGSKITPNLEVRINNTDKLTLSKDYTLNLKDVFREYAQDDSTKIMQSQKGTSLTFDSEKTIINNGEKTIVFDSNKTTINDLSEIDSTPFINIGRSVENKIVISKQTISSFHCKIRMITPLMIEIEDLGSTNGTFADNIRLEKNIRNRYSSNVKIRLGQDTNLDLKKIFPSLEIIEKKSNNISNNSNAGSYNSEITKKELQEFMDLENVWKEYNQRHSNALSTANNYSIGGAIIGGIASIALAPIIGPVGMVASLGGGILGRYLGQQETNKIKNDYTYDDMFLQVYSCPRCKESFQRKPWITIRDCNKCRIKFR